ncbi:transketolase-like protein 2 isoform X2 [Acanthaster planci]|uniref:Transketolase n=1 Tax=Acanthaster planci TaxID=133434 RepID=A0A8B7ZGV3_ACAPL|nr:transketolase-like protein 2 isoform X2 [Acanthaster planci]
MATLDKAKLQELIDMANRLRIDSIKATSAATSGHPTSCCSAAEIMSVLFFHVMKYRLDKPKDPASDRFVMSKGHAAPILYAAWAEAGLFPVDNLLTLRQNTSVLEGHPTPRLNFIDVGTGSLGQGLSIACGMAYSGKYWEKADYRTYCLVGDGESAEGSIWEACAFASYYKLDNLVAIFDVNRLGQSQEAPLQHDTDAFRRRLEGFGWHVYVLEDGHSVEDLCKAFFGAAQVKDMPTAIVAKTLKGKGIPGIEDELNWHGKALGDKAAAALEAISARIVNKGPHGLKPSAPSGELPARNITNIQLSSPPDYPLGEKVAPRVAYGVGLRKIGDSNECVVAMDGDTKNSTYADTFRKAHPNRFVECFIAEQNLVGVAIGTTCRDRNVAFVSTFACFLSRAFDQIRMGAISETNTNFCGSHCGISIGEDGASQMALEDLAMFRSIPGSTVFYPSDAVSMERAVELAANTKGICFIRSSRPAMPVLYTAEEPFVIGKAKVVRESADDKVTVIGAGVTLDEAMKAYEILAKEGIKVRIIDPFTIKPLDKDTILAAAKATGGKVVTVEDHYPQGGIGEAVAGALAGNSGIIIRSLAVGEVPRSGSKDFLLDHFGISAKQIQETVKAMLA